MPTGAYSVLVVDDSSVNRSYLHYILDEEGYRVLGQQRRGLPEPIEEERPCSSSWTW
jgi:CheY-like chemotaxis protein